jgi:prophage tail gpP-like protein
MPKPSEIAVLSVNGQLYQDWETVMVRHAKQDVPFFYFRFTCSEGMPLSKNFAKLQIRPGDYCTITLAGQPAFAGFVHTRQVFYSGKQHHIEIQGCSQVMELSYSSVVHKTMENNNMTIEQHIRNLLKPFPKIQFKIEGGKLPTIKFPRLSMSPGTTVMEAIEIPLRALGGIDLTSNVKGDLVAVVGKGSDTDTVTEGIDILEGREIIYQPGYQSGLYGIGQAPPGDQQSGTQGAHEKFHKNIGEAMNSLAQATPGVIPLEIPAFLKGFLAGRTNADRDWQNKDWVTVFITLQGWLRRDGKLWDRNQQVRVKSPMLIMDGSLDLSVKSATFTQENQTGSRTVLELCNPLALGGGTPQGPQT